MPSDIDQLIIHFSNSITDSLFDRGYIEANNFGAVEEVIGDEIISFIESIKTLGLDVFEPHKEEE